MISPPEVSMIQTMIRMFRRDTKEPAHLMTIMNDYFMRDSSKLFDCI